MNPRFYVFISFALILLTSQIVFCQFDEPFTPDEKTIGIWRMDESEPDCLLTAEYDLGEECMVNDIIQTSDGAYLICGGREAQNDPRRMFLLKIAPDGTEIWRRYYGFQNFSYIQSVVELPDGQLASVGKVEGGVETRDDGYILFTASNGDSIDFQAYGGFWDQIFNHIFYLNNRLYVFGINLNREQNIYDFSMFISNQNGDSLGWHNFGIGATLRLNDAEQCPNNDFLLAGCTENERNELEAIIMRVDPQGEIVWVRNHRFDLAENYYLDIITDHDYIFCLGLRAYDPPREDQTYLVQLDSDGRIITEYALGEEPPVMGFNLCKNNEGDVVFTGLTQRQENSPISCLVIVSPFDRSVQTIGFDWEGEYRFTSVASNLNDTYALAGTKQSGENNRSLCYLLTDSDRAFTADASGNRMHGTIIGEAAVSDDAQFGNAMEIDRENGGYMQIRRNAPFQRLREFCVECWIKPDPEPEEPCAVLAKKSDIHPYDFQILLDPTSRNIGFMMRFADENKWLFAGVDLAEDRWVYIAGSYDKHRMGLSIDGELADWMYVGEPIDFGWGDFLIGGNEADAGGEFQYYGLIDGVKISDSIPEYLHVAGNEPPLPRSFRSLSVYPNPFNDRLTIHYSINRHETLSLNIFDVDGRKVKTITHGIFDPGSHRINWQPQNLPSGCYFILLQGNDWNSVIEAKFVK